MFRILANHGQSWRSPWVGDMEQLFGASHLHPSGGCAVPPAAPAVEPIGALTAHAFPQNKSKRPPNGWPFAFYLAERGSAFYFASGAQMISGLEEF